MELRLTLGDTVLEGSLLDSVTSRDFRSLLPLTLTFEDFQGTEKVSELPRELSTADAPAGIDPEIGDITYYAPWGNVAIFYNDSDYASGLVKLGHINSDINVLRNAIGEFTLNIDEAESN